MFFGFCVPLAFFQGAVGEQDSAPAFLHQIGMWLACGVNARVVHHYLVILPERIAAASHGSSATSAKHWQWRLEGRVAQSVFPAQNKKER